MNEMIPAWIVEYAALLGRGLQTTITILLISMVFGFVLAVLVALARISKNKVIARASLFYTSVLRGTPLLIQIYIFYYGLGSLFAQFYLATSINRLFYQHRGAHTILRK